jgi:hypothetical protein
MTLIPWQVKAAGAAIGVVLIFGAGVKVEGWRDTGALDSEKTAHANDVKGLQDQWQKKLDAGQDALRKAQADLEVERNANQIAREDAQNAHEATISKLKTAAGLAAADAQRVRDELAAAQAAGRAASGGSPVRQTEGSTAACSGSGSAICGLLSRAVDLAQRCTDAAGTQHAAVVEAVSAWPR